ncbi:MAG: amidohydrolase [Rhodospirillales bacterium]|nr:amidohydrolase [Rhodospirillales bacterium]
MSTHTIYYGGPIITVNGEDQVADAVLISDGKFIAVGDYSDIKASAPPSTQVIDLKGRSMVPGFIDPHGHFPDSGMLALFQVDVSGPPLGPCNTITDLLGRLEKKVTDTPPGEWVVGNLFEINGVEEKRYPTRWELDSVSTDHIIVVYHISGHGCVTNTPGLAHCNLDKDSPDPVGGRYGRYLESGELNGELDGMGAMKAIGELDAQLTPEKFKAGFRAAAREYLSKGVTLAQNAWATENLLRLFSHVAHEDEPAIDVMVLPAAHLEPRLSNGELDFDFPEGTRIMRGPRKLFADGSFPLQTAVLSKPYHRPLNGDPNYCGKLAITRESMIKHVGALHDAGFQTHTHVNGDGTADVMLDVMEAVLAANPREDHRHTFIHCQTFRDDQLDRMKELGLTPSFFPAHIHYWGDVHCEVTVGPERAARLSPAGSAVRKGLRFTIHNDATVTPTLPLHLMWCAVNRTTTSGVQLGRDQCITPMQALRAHTLDAAWQVFLDHERGSIEPGKRADFVILSENPLENPSGLKDIIVEQTVVRGETVYQV